MCAHMASKTMNARRGGADIEIITRDQVIELDPVWWVVHGLTVNPDPSSSLPSMSGIKKQICGLEKLASCQRKINLEQSGRDGW